MMSNTVLLFIEADQILKGIVKILILFRRRIADIVYSSLSSYYVAPYFGRDIRAIFDLGIREIIEC